MANAPTIEQLKMSMNDLIKDLMSNGILAPPPLYTLGQTASAKSRVPYYYDDTPVKTFEFKEFKLPENSSELQKVSRNCDGKITLHGAHGTIEINIDGTKIGVYVEGRKVIVNGIESRNPVEITCK